MARHPPVVIRANTNAFPITERQRGPHYLASERRSEAEGERPVRMFPEVGVRKQQASGYKALPNITKTLPVTVAEVERVR